MFLMNFITVYILLVLPLPLTLATGAVSFVSPFDVAYYEKHCHDDFSTGCPVYGHVSWNCSSMITNCTSPDYPYHCILNTAGKVVHVCAAAQICPKGTFPIFDPRTHMVSCQNCQKGYFQSLQIWSYNTRVCIKKFGCDISYHKIECTVEPEKEHTQDTLCRCDVRNDYILSNSEGREICVPGKFADCYELKCPDGQERLLNYTCAPRCEEGFQRNDSDICVPKSTVITTTEGDKATPTSTVSTENVSKGSISENNVIIVTVVIFVTVAIILIIAIVLCCKGMICSRQFSQVHVCWKRRSRRGEFSQVHVCWKRRSRRGEFSQVPVHFAASVQGEEFSQVHIPSDSMRRRREFSQECCITRLCDCLYRQVRTADEMETMAPSNAPNDVQDPRTSSNDTNGNASMERPNQGTTAYARPWDIRNQERPRQEKLRRIVLNRCLRYLLENLDFDSVLIPIQEKEIFEYLIIRDIMEQATTNKKILLLIEKLAQKPQDKYEEFKRCLVLSNQEYLKEKLEKVEEEVTKEIRDTHQSQDTALDMDVSLPGNSLDAV